MTAPNKQSESIHLHLDTVGGIAGDMFVAALLDARPELETEMLAALTTADLDTLVTVNREDFDDGTLTGSRITVAPVGAAATGPEHGHGAAEHVHHHDHHHGVHEHTHDHGHGHGHDHGHEHDHGHSHAHTHRAWRDIRAMLQQAKLPTGAKSAAIEIFSELAKAEARVHGKSVDDVAFHEVGAWDSIADIVMAGWLIDRMGITSTSSSALPMGRGLVPTAHGRLPVPTPATALLLEGMPLVDDGLEGERVTPTGAAILKFLQPTFSGSNSPRVLQGTGAGFGTKRFPGISNMLRASLYDSHSAPGFSNEQIALIEFEIDDQTPEDLGVGLEALRNSSDVLDVVQSTVTGKKNRLMIRVQVMTRISAVNSVLERCFTQTTTLGARWQIINRAVLDRTPGEKTVGNNTIRIKTARRPDGSTTTKAEIDDLADGDSDNDSHRHRQALRRDAEDQ